MGSELVKAIDSFSLDDVLSGVERLRLCDGSAMLWWRRFLDAGDDGLRPFVLLLPTSILPAELGHVADGVFSNTSSRALLSSATRDLAPSIPTPYSLPNSITLIETPTRQTRTQKGAVRWVDFPDTSIQRKRKLRCLEARSMQ